VLDRRTDKNASTGLFELAFRQPPVPVPPYVGVSLTIEGQLLKKPSPSGESGTGKKTTCCRASLDGNATQNKCPCENSSGEPMMSVCQLKVVDVGTVSSQRVAVSRTSQTKTIKDSSANSVSESKTRRKLSSTAATSSHLAVDEMWEKLDNVHVTEDIKGRSKGQEKGVTRRQRTAVTCQLCSADSVDSGSKALSAAWTIPKTTTITGPGVKSSGSLKASATDRRRSSVPAVSPKSLAMRKRRKAAQAGGARPRSHRRRSTLDRDELTSNHHGTEHTTSTTLAVASPPPPPPPSTQRIPSASKKNTGGAVACNTVYSIPLPLGSSVRSRQTQRRRTPSFQDVTLNSHVTSTTRPVAVCLNDLSNVNFPASCAQNACLPTDSARTGTLYPSMPSFGVRQPGTSRKMVVPIDCYLHCSPDCPTCLQLMTPASRSSVMRSHNLTDLQSSMQIIGLGNTNSVSFR